MTITREEWLNLAAARLLADDVLGRYLPEELPALSVGYPARATRRVKLHDIVWDAEGCPQVYVSPMLADPAEVLAVLLYSLAETCFPPRAARAPRGRWSRYYAPRTSTLAEVRTSLGYEPGRDVVPNSALMATLSSIAAELVPYPHVYTDPTATRAATQTTRMLKIVCPGEHDDEQGDYILRMTRTQYDRGEPVCGVCGTRMSIA